MTRLFLFFLTLCLTGHTLAAETHTLAKDGTARYVIVLADRATPVETTAARELKLHLDEATGADFQIVNNANADTPKIFIGDTPRVRELLDGLNPAELPYDGILRRSVGDDLILVGHPQRGTLYAVSTLLEDAVGVRWWSSTESFIPQKPTLAIPAQSVQYAPKLIYREAYYRDATQPLFATRMKCNGNMLAIPPEYGGHFSFCYFVHSFFPLLPPEKYFADHPEWYSEIAGVRKHDHAQLCLTNDAMREELTRNAIAALEKRPDAKFLSISQNDWHGYCQCDKCTALAESEGSQAGPLLHFVNRVAEDVEKKFPDVWVETLAYQYTRVPPKHVRPRKNVVVRLCSIECSFVQPLAAGEQNKKFREDIEGWSKVADRLFIWDYTVNFSAYMLPHPNHRVLGPNVRFFVDNNTIGIFEQGDSYCLAGDFARLKNWLLAQMMWNPDRDPQTLIDEFIAGYYGPGATPLVKEYWTLLLDRAEASGVYLGCFRLTTRDWLDMATLARATDLMNRAVEAAGDDTFRNRLRRDRLPIDLVMLRDYHAMRRRAALTGEPFVGPENIEAALDDFFARCKEFNVTAAREYQGPKDFAAFEADMRQRAGKAAPAPDLCKNLPANCWIDVQEFEFNRHKQGQWTFDVDDAAASNGRAVKMPGSHHEWAASYNFDDSLGFMQPADPEKIAETPRFRLYAAVRCEASVAAGPAMTLGVYDYAEEKSVVHKTLAVADIVGSEYRWIDLGVIALKPGHNFWFAPPKRPGEVDAVYIDRIVVVREE